MRHCSVSCVLLLMCSPMLHAGGLDDLVTVRDRSSHRASSHDPTGGNLDNITSFAPGTSHVLLEADGPGQINHMWFTVSNFPNHPTVFRDLVLRIYWENSPIPSVEAPLGDFFALGHGKLYTIQSLPIAVGRNSRALNCYWRMPFYKHAKIEIFNNGRKSIRRIYYNIDYEQGPLPPNQGLFHARFRHAAPLETQSHEGNTTGKDNYVILDTTGRGQYVGCALFVDAEPGGWWGEGDEMIFIDQAELPTIVGTGSEDYFCNAWGYQEAFSYPYYGAPLLEKRSDQGSFTTVYRWHIPDPVRFSKQIRVTIEHLFSDNIVNHYSSMAYWYQLKPIDRRVPLPVAEANHPVSHDRETLAPTTFELDGTELEAEMNARGIQARALTSSLRAGYHNGGFLSVPLVQGRVRINVPVPEEGNYRVQIKFVDHLLDPTIAVKRAGSRTITVTKQGLGEHESLYVDLGSAASVGKMVALLIQGGSVIGIDHLKVKKVE